MMSLEKNGVNLYGNYVTKIESAFLSGDSSLELTFKEQNDKRMHVYTNKSKWFPKDDYLWGSSQTFNYFYNSLFFFGLKNEKYPEKKIERECKITIKEINNFDTFEDYILNTSYKEIFKNFYKDKMNEGSSVLIILLL